MTTLQEAARKALACLELYDHEDLASCEARHELRTALAQLAAIAATEPESIATDQTDEFGEVIYREVYTRPMPAPSLTKIEDPVTVPRGLLGAACRAIAHKDDAPNTLEQLRQYTVGNLSPSMTGKAARSFDKAWSLFCSEIGEDKSPYPGMIGAFEAHYGQSFKDKDWRNEASVWAQAWSAATRAALVRAEPAGWQPIETAPKDFTTMFDGWNGERVCDVQLARPEYAPKDHYAWCYSEYENGYGWVNHEVKGLTHWMPLPASPKDTL